MFRVLSLGALGMMAVLALLPAAGHDQMWLLYAARLHLGGAALYGPQIFETNPPMILWMSEVPAKLSEWIRISDTACGKLLVCGLVAAIGWWCRRLRGGAGWGWVFCWIVVFGVLPARDLGQRDYLLGLFLVPYVVICALRGEGKIIHTPVAIAAGLLGITGTVLKPQQSGIFVGVELLLGWWRWRSGSGVLRRLVRPETVAFVVGGFVFLAAVWRGTPLYFSQTVPLVRATYWAYSLWSWDHLLVQAIELHVLLAILAVLLLFPISTRRFTIVLTMAAAMATIGYWQQGTGWYYQQLPALDFGVFALASRVAEIAEARQWRLPAWTVSASAWLSALAVGLTLHFSGYPVTPARSFPVDVPAPALFSDVKPGDAVMTLSPTVDDTIQPIYKYHLTLGQRYPAFLLLPAVLRAEDDPTLAARHHLSPARVRELVTLQQRMMREDLLRWRPKLVLVERCQDPKVRCQVLEDRHDDLLAWFARDPAFRIAFAGYRKVRTVGAYDGWER